MSNPRPSGRELLRVVARRAMVARGLEPDFPAAAQAETETIVRHAGAAQGATARDPTEPARDLTGLLWCSIDNDDSRDLDQLSVAEALADGAVRVLVAIADVDALVAKGSAIDAHAATNTTSVYTPAVIFPMLPEALSTDLTSLGEAEDRLAVVVELVVSAGGEVTSSSVARARVRNQAKLAYDAVAAWLDGEAPPPARLAAVPGLEEQLRVQDRVAQAMKGVRQRRGALTLETREARAVFDGDEISDLRPDEKNRAKELIENLMIAANGATTRFLDERKVPTLRRVLPEPVRWDRIVAVAAAKGESLPPRPDAAALEGFLDRSRRADPEGFAEVSLSVVKLLGSGEYAVAAAGAPAVGHFGLAVRDYGHSTAPNRRFPDLIAQRQLKTALAGRPAAYGRDELTALARHCTLQEDNAAKVERQVRKAAAAQLLAGRIGERFEAIVTGASEKGTWVRISRPAVEGKVVSGAGGLDVGDRLRVELVSTDVEHGFIDFVRSR